jgi:hypothetical protein
MNLSPDWPPPVSRESSRTNGYLRMESFNESETVELLMQVDSNVNSMATNVKRVFQHKTIHMKELINTFMSLI